VKTRILQRDLTQKGKTVCQKKTDRERLTEWTKSKQQLQLRSAKTMAILAASITLGLRKDWKVFRNEEGWMRFDNFAHYSPIWL
jgi:hypothetical protein